MNPNASVYANDITLLSSASRISEQASRVGEMIFLIAYAFRGESWAPWSEELGRWPVLQHDLFFVNVWQILCALAPNFGTIVVGRFLGSLSSAGRSVTLVLVADMWDADDQQFAVAFIVISSVAGSVVGPVVGDMQTYLDWHRSFWIQLIFGGTVQTIHFIFVPETNPDVLLDLHAEKMRTMETLRSTDLENSRNIHLP
jgi:predicted MFS family arabinose efflux permease